MIDSISDNGGEGKKRRSIEFFYRKTFERESQHTKIEDPDKTEDQRYNSVERI